MTVNLEKNRGAFVGRQAELRALKEAIENCRIVTLVGPGGVGKSRLAEEHFQQMDLEPIQIGLDEIADGKEIPAHIARAMGLEPVGLADIGRASTELVDTHTILFFDNAEHLLEELRTVLEALPSRALITSRQPLNIADESVLVIPELPEDDGLGLLRQRASRLGVTLDDVDGRELVRTLDSLPLAIELAAARLVVLDPKQLLSRLQESNSALGMKRAGRHTTLDNTMEWSWDTLSETEQQLMMMLGMFDHPLDPLMLEELWPELDVIGIALELESKSWLRVIQSAPGRRWSTLSILRRFVRTKVTAETTQDHRSRIQEWAKTHESEQPGWWAHYVPEGLLAIRVLAESGDCIGASKLLSRLFFGAFGGVLFSPVLNEASRLLGMISPEEHPLEYSELATKLAKGAFRYRGQHRSSEWSKKALEAAPENTITWLAAASQHVLCLVDDGERNIAESLFLQVVKTAEDFPDDMKIASTLLDVAAAAHEMGQFDALRSICQRLLEIGRAAGNADVEARAWIHLSYASYDLGEFERGAEEAGNLDALMEHRHPHERLVVGGAVPPLLQLQMGKPDACYASLKEREAIALETRHYGLEFFVLVGLAEWASAHNMPATQEYLKRALNNASVNHSPKSVAHARFLLALEELAADDPTSARRRLESLREIKPPAKPEQWNDALASFYWLCEMRLQATEQPAPDSPFGRLAEATLRTIQGETRALEDLIRSTPSSAHNVPGLYLTRLDITAQRIANRLGRAGHVLRMDREGRKFQVDSGDVHDMTRKGVTRKVLFRLAQTHSEDPHRAMSVSDVIEAGWPGEIISHDAALTRVYTLMNRLRAADLADLLITQDDGYALGPNVRVDWVDDL